MRSIKRWRVATKRNPEVVRVDEAPAGLAKLAEHIRPDRLDNVGRVELGAVGGRQVPADRLAQVRFEGKKDLLRGRRVATAQLGKQVIQGLGHDLLRQMTRRRAGHPIAFPGGFLGGPPPLAAGDRAGGGRRPGLDPGPQPVAVLVRGQALAQPLQAVQELLHAVF
jgi:hypothetical protein